MAPTQPFDIPAGPEPDAADPLEGLISMEDLAPALKPPRSVKTVRRMVTRGELPRPIRIGRTRYFDLRLMREHLRHRAEAANTPPTRGRKSRPRVGR
jgi:hypothetical protein